MQDSFNAQNNVNHTTNRISVAGHNFTNNDKITYSVGGGAAIGGLVNGQDYYVGVYQGTPFNFHTFLVQQLTLLQEILEALMLK